MLITKTKESILQVYVWCADSSLPENEANLQKIRQWWMDLDGKTIIWEVFSGTISATTPVISELLVIDSALLEGNVLGWRKQGLENWNSIPVQHLVLDDSLQRLDIIPSLQDWFGCKYRVQILN